MFKILLSVAITSTCFSNVFGASRYQPIITFEASPIQLSTTFVSDGQILAEHDNVNYFVINQCFESTANLKYSRLNIIVPDNPALDTSSNDGYPVVELSRCKNSWEAVNCFIGSNYIWSNHPLIFNNITWVFGNEPEDIYVRIRSYNREVPLSLLLTYSDDGSENLGNYTEGVIPGVTAPSNTLYETLLQYVKSTTISRVSNNGAQAFFFGICSRYIPYNGDYGLSITVVGDINSPLSAFDLIGCAYSNTPNVDDCTTANLKAISNQDASPLVSITMTNNDNNDLTQGVWLVVTGQGGNIDLRNDFTIDVVIS